MPHKRKQSVEFWRQIALLVALVSLAIYLLFLYVTSLLNSGPWKTVTDEQYGFAFEYPANWEAETYGESGFRGYTNLKASAFTGTLFPPLRRFMSVRVYWLLMDNPTTEQVEIWVTEEIEQPAGSNISTPVDVQIGLHSYPAIRQTYQTQNSLKQIYYLHNEDSAYIIELRASPFDPDTEFIFEHVLATFHIFTRSQE
jgi:hypothetical protein